ncbi:restriction endonuclease subunit S [Stenotrophomonas daejeonensis]|uniref:restriction endonuclease subunit S n=1 Tax=Stenotrophomonas daejeonensis TaxID=659018 RepID=UPI001B8008BB|nr:restriction endonuclease subunit S [Stenotrophomonas daejeonensis]
METTISDIAEVARGGSPRPIKSFITDGPGGVNWIKIGDTEKGGRYIESTAEKIKPEGIRSSRWVEEGDFLLSNSMSFGRPYILKTSGCIHDGWLVLKPDYTRVDQGYLYYVLSSPSVFQQFDSRAAGSTVRNLNIDLVSGVTISLPPLDEQKRIVAKLDQAFAVLDRARTHAEANLADALSLYSRVVDSELSDDKLGRLEGLGSHVDLLTGFAFKSKGYTDDPGDIRLIRGDNIVQGEFRWAGVKRWPSSEKSIYSKYELALGDVLIAMDRTWVSAGIKYAIVDEKALPSLLVQRVARLRTKSTLLPRYLGYWIGSHAFEKYVLSIQKGLGVPHVSGSQLEGFNIRVPSIEEQRAVIERLDALSEHHSMLVAAYERQLAEVAALRQSLLQQAFSGQLT